MNEPKFGVRKWLWLVLAGVIVITAAYVGWNRYGGNGTTETATISPSPTKSLALSPSAGTTTSPVSGKTSTPSSTSTPTPTPALVLPNFPAPTGWKLVTWSLTPPTPHNPEPISISVYLRENWQAKSPDGNQYSLQYYDQNNNKMFYIAISGCMSGDEGAKVINTKDTAGNATQVCIITQNISTDDLQTLIKSLEQK